MNDKKITDLLYKLNKKALKYNDVPVSCIITYKTKIISYAYNKRKRKSDPLAHAEIIAIRQAAKKLCTWNLTDCILYVTLYPCKMCQEVIKESRIKTVKYILDSQKEVIDNVKYLPFAEEEKEHFSSEIKEFFANKR